MIRREFTSAGLGGMDLYAQAWLPDESLDAVVVLSHGLGEHSGRYARLAAELVERRYGVYALDHRGHGRSGGPRANIERFDYLVSDFCTFVGRAMRRHPDTPVIALGHSMGGAVAFASAARLQGSLRGLVLSAPALATGEDVAAPRRWLARALSAVAPNTGLLQLPPTAVSRERQVVHDYIADPLVHHAAVPARTLVELLDAMEGFPALAPRLRVPVLVLHGTADTLVPLAATRPVYQSLDARLRTLRVYEGLYHEVFNEPERDQVVRDLLDWLRRLT
jgi:alpha-beta hydrolase superfamily lysophospholipase